MDEKDLDLEKESAEILEDESTETAENESAEITENESAETEDGENGSEVTYEENDNWQFEASAPTLENNLDIGGGYQIDNLDVPEQSAAPAESESTEKKPKSKKPLIIALAAILCAALTAVVVFFGIRFFTVPNSNEKMNPGNVALTVGDTKVSVGMYNFYYTSIVNNYISYATYGYYDLDTNSDYSTQKTVDKDGNEITWLDLFKQDTIDRIQYITSYYEAAVDADLTLTEEQQSTIDEQLESIEKSASDADKSVDAYIQENYGDYCGIATLRKMLEQSYLAQNYYNESMVTMTPTEAETTSYFEEHKNDYMSVSYATVEIGTIDGEAEDKEQAIADAEERAKTYCDKISNLDDMKAIIPEACADLIEEYISYGYFKDTEDAVKTISDSLEATETAEKIKNNFGEDIAAWAFDTSNPVGSTTYSIDDEYGYVYVFLKTSEQKLDETELYSVRHILIQPKAEEETSDSEDAAADNTATEPEYTDEQWAAALDKANSVLDEYNQGEKTELAFAKLAEQYSDDTQSTAAGSSGLYGGSIEGVGLGEMVPEFEEWATDDARKYGDVDIVKSKYGYHIMYFIFDGPNYLYNVMTDVKSEKEDEFIDSHEVKERLGLKKAKVAAPVTTTAAQ